MIKYTICSDQLASDEKNLREMIKWVEDMFHIIEENGLEDEVHNLDVGHSVTIASNIFDGDVEITHRFQRTGNNRGLFTQTIEEPSGLHLHSNSLEFTYE